MSFRRVFALAASSRAMYVARGVTHVANENGLCFVFITILTSRPAIRTAPLRCPLSGARSLSVICELSPAILGADGPSWYLRVQVTIPLLSAFWMTGAGNCATPHVGLIGLVSCGDAAAVDVALVGVV